jgi:hypothetical protein
MFRLLVIALFSVSLAATVVANIPLSFALRLSGAAERGLSWQQARGTVWDGQMTGLVSAGVDLGTLGLKSQPMSLILGRPAAGVQLSAGAVEGRLDASLAGREIRITDLSVNADLARLSNLRPQLRQAGGTLSLRAGASLDTVRRIGLQYGRDWPLVSGDLTCEAGAVLIRLSGTGPAQERFDLDIRFHQAGSTEIRVLAAALDPDAAGLLPALGFRNTPEGLVFYQDTSRPN